MFLHVCFEFLVHFFAAFYKTTTWNNQALRILENANRISYFLVLLELNAVGACLARPSF